MRIPGKFYAMDDYNWIKENARDWFPSQSMYKDCDEEPTKKQIDNLYKISVGAQERFDNARAMQTCPKAPTQQQQKGPTQQKNSASQSVDLENTSARIRTIINWIHGRTGYEYVIANKKYDTLFKHHGTSRSVLLWEKKMEDYKKDVVEKHGEYKVPKTQELDFELVFFSVEEEMKLNFENKQLAK